MPDGESTLVSALDELAAMGTERDREQLDRLDAARLRVLVVVGEAKRGKSTLINALLGRDVLPSGVTWPNGKRYCITSSACWTRPRRRGRRLTLLRAERRPPDEPTNDRVET